MIRDYRYLKVTEYLEKTAEASATPGGGSVAALLAALGAALGRMVYGLTVTKKSFQAKEEAVKAEVTADWQVLTGLQAEFTELIDKDIQAFNQFMVALALPRETEEEKAARQEALSKASVLAMEVPLETAGKALELLRHLDSLASHGHKSSISDAGVAALCAHAALQASVLNIRINLAGIDDPGIREEAEQSAAAFIEEGDRLTRILVDRVYSRL